MRKDTVQKRPFPAAMMFARSEVSRVFRENHLTKNDIVFVGLSGGADSLALASVAAYVGRKMDVQVGAILVNHNLQEGSAEVSQVAADKALKMGLYPVIIESVKVDESPGMGGPENAARVARYEVFEKVLAEHNGRFVLTAHTKNDNAEQVLLGLARGSGIKSLSGIPAVRDYMLRPFLQVSREQVLAICDTENLDPWFDPQNNDEVYTRVRVRNTVIPMLETELGSGTVDALARTALVAREESEALDYLIAEKFNGIEIVGSEENPNVELPISSLESAPVGVMSRVIRNIVEKYWGEDVYWSREHTLMVVSLITSWNGQKALDLPGGTVSRIGKSIFFIR